MTEPQIPRLGGAAQITAKLDYALRPTLPSRIRHAARVALLLLVFLIVFVAARGA